MLVVGVLDPCPVACPEIFGVVVLKVDLRLRIHWQLARWIQFLVGVVNGNLVTIVVSHCYQAVLLDCSGQLFEAVDHGIGFGEGSAVAIAVGDQDRLQARGMGGGQIVGAVANKNNTL